MRRVPFFCKPAPSQASHRVTFSFRHPSALAWGSPWTAGGSLFHNGPIHRSQNFQLKFRLKFQPVQYSRTGTAATLATCHPLEAHLCGCYQSIPRHNTVR